MSLGLVGATLVHALLQLRLNVWLGDFFNALDAHAGARIWHGLGVFVLLAFGLMAAAAAQIHLKMGIQASWRRWITERLIARWLDHGHAYALRFRDAEYDNPDYRIAEDVRLVIEATIDFAAGLVNSALLLVMFLGVLWSLSEQGGPIPGYLVVTAIIYALLTTGLTHLFGRRLVTLSEDLHAREGDFRYNLVRVRDNAEGIALSRGEADERHSLAQVFDRLIGAWRRLVGLQTRLAWLTSGFSVATPVVPLLVAAPQYIAGSIMLGGLVQASQAFVQVQLALGFMVDNYARISDWLAGIHRIVQFGCFRLYPEHIETLFPQVPVGTPVTVVYQPVKTGWVEGELYLEMLIPMTRGDMGDYLGLTIETVSRTISKLRRLKLAAVPTPDTVTLLDRDEIEQLAAGESIHH